MIATFAKESTSAMCQCLEFLNRIFPFKFNNIFLLNINPLGAGPDFFQIILRGLRRKEGGGEVKVVEILNIFILATNVYIHKNKTNVKLTLINQNKNVLPNQLFIVYFVNEGN